MVIFFKAIIIHAQDYLGFFGKIYKFFSSIDYAGSLRHFYIQILRILLLLLPLQLHLLVTDTIVTDKLGGYPNIVTNYRSLLQNPFNHNNLTTI